MAWTNRGVTPPNREQYEEDPLAQQRTPLKYQDEDSRLRLPNDALERETPDNQLNQERNQYRVRKYERNPFKKVG